MKYKNLNDLVALIRRHNLAKSKDIRMSIDFANSVQAELAMLLLELKETEEGPTTITLDGGKF